jgi:hypothetical protein
MDHPEKIDRFRFTCLSCRTRRRLAGKFSDPPFWIDYTLKSNFTSYLVDKFVQDGKEYSARNGGKLKVTWFTTVKIDPRGRFTALRCAAIMVLDKIMTAFHVGKPLAEFCEFLANFPT